MLRLNTDPKQGCASRQFEFSEFGSADVFTDPPVGTSSLRRLQLKRALARFAPGLINDSRHYRTGLLGC